MSVTGILSALFQLSNRLPNWNASLFPTAPFIFNLTIKFSGELLCASTVKNVILLHSHVCTLVLLVHYHRLKKALVLYGFTRRNQSSTLITHTHTLCQGNDIFALALLKIFARRSSSSSSAALGPLLLLLVVGCAIYVRFLKFWMLSFSLFLWPSEKWVAFLN